MPSLENLNQHFKNKQFELLVINVLEEKETVQSFMGKNTYSFQALLDEDGRVSVRYGVRSHPMKFLINKYGDLIGSALGYRKWDTNEMKSLIQLLINS